jgi:hypothetical protein
MILRIASSEVVGPFTLRLAFNNGQERIVNVAPLFNGPIFEPLRDPSYFSMARLDPICGTVVWPNGADFAPEALYEASAVAECVSS